MILFNILEFKQLFWTVGIIAYFLILVLTSKRFNFQWWKGFLVGLVTLVIVAVGAKLMYILERFDIVKEIGLTFNGFSLFGAIFFLPLASLASKYIFKKSYYEIGTFLIVPLVVMLGFYRIDCLVQGCCGGIDIGGIKFPTQLTEIIFCVIVSIVFSYFIYFKKKTDGMLYSSFFVIYGVFRFLLEFLRKRDYIFSIFSISHIWAYLSIALGIVLLIINYRYNKNRVNIYEK